MRVPRSNAARRVVTAWRFISMLPVQQRRTPVCIRQQPPRVLAPESEQGSRYARTSSDMSNLEEDLKIVRACLCCGSMIYILFWPNLSVSAQCRDHNRCCNGLEVLIRRGRPYCGVQASTSLGLPCSTCKKIGSVLSSARVPRVSREGLSESSELSNPLGGLDDNSRSSWESQQEYRELSLESSESTYNTSTFSPRFR